MGNFHVSSALGLLGEELGCRYLKGKGYRIKETNYCNATGRRLGEVDIVAEKDGVLIFVEVKSRLARNGNDILPEAAITRDKLHKLERIAQCYLRERHLEARAYRFDALAILYDGSAKKALIRHLEHIFL